MNILITLCARGGSKGIPGKNIRPLNNISLIGYSINCANRFKNTINAEVDIALSTDSEEIKYVAKEFGLQTNYLRPAEFAGDKAGKLDAIIHVKEYYEEMKSKKYNYLLDLDISSPLRTVEDLIAAFDIIDKDKDSLNLFSVNVANRNPYFNMVERSVNGYYELSKKLDNNILSRQAAPEVYELNASFYFYKNTFFNQETKAVISSKSLIYQMPHICFDLDHEIDFDFMEYLISNNKLDFSI